MKFGAEEEKPETKEQGTYIREIKLDTEAYNAQAREDRREEKVKGDENSERLNTEEGISEQESPISTKRV